MDKEKKRIARYICLQAIYAYEVSEDSHAFDDSNSMFTKHFQDDLVDFFGELLDSQIAYSKRLYEHSITNKAFVDQLITDRLNNWDISRLAIIDKIILRMSVSEMFFINDVPPKVSITEGVEIAKVFSTKDSSSFVNGILDAVYNEVYMKDKKINKE
jgi:N utilization substance protein B